MKFKDFVFNSLRVRGKKKKSTPETGESTYSSTGCFGLEKNKNRFRSLSFKRRSSDCNIERNDLAEANWQKNALYQGLVPTETVEIYSPLIYPDSVRSNKVRSSRHTMRSRCWDSNLTVLHNIDSSSQLSHEMSIDSYVYKQHCYDNPGQQDIQHRRNHTQVTSVTEIVDNQQKLNKDNCNQKKFCCHKSQEEAKPEIGFFRKMASFRGSRKNSNRKNKVSAKQIGEDNLACSLCSHPTSNLASCENTPTNIGIQRSKNTKESNLVYLENNKENVLYSENEDKICDMECGTQNDIKSVTSMMDSCISTFKTNKTISFREYSTESWPSHSAGSQEDASIRDLDLESFESTSMTSYESEFYSGKFRRSRSRIKTNPWISSQRHSHSSRRGDYESIDYNDNDMKEKLTGCTRSVSAEYQRLPLSFCHPLPMTDSDNCNRRHSSRELLTPNEYQYAMNRRSPINSRTTESMRSCDRTTSNILSLRRGVRTFNDLSSVSAPCTQPLIPVSKSEFSQLADNIEHLANNISFEYDELMYSSLETVGKQRSHALSQEISTAEEVHNSTKLFLKPESCMKVSNSPDSGIGETGYPDSDVTVFSTTKTDTKPVTAVRFPFPEDVDTIYRYSKINDDPYSIQDNHYRSQLLNSCNTLQYIQYNQFNRENIPLSSPHLPNTQTKVSTRTVKHGQSYSLEHSSTAVLERGDNISYNPRRAVTNAVHEPHHIISNSTEISNVRTDITTNESQTLYNSPVSTVTYDQLGNTNQPLRTTGVSTATVDKVGCIYQYSNPVSAVTHDQSVNTNHINLFTAAVDTVGGDSYQAVYGGSISIVNQEKHEDTNEATSPARECFDVKLSLDFNKLSSSGSLIETEVNNGADTVDFHVETEVDNSTDTLDFHVETEVDNSTDTLDFHVETEVDNSTDTLDFHVETEVDNSTDTVNFHVEAKQIDTISSHSYKDNHCRLVRPGTLQNVRELPTESNELTITCDHIKQRWTGTEKLDFPMNIAVEDCVESPTENWKLDDQFFMYSSQKSLLVRPQVHKQVLGGKIQFDKVKKNSGQQHFQTEELVVTFDTSPIKSHTSIDYPCNQSFCLEDYGFNKPETRYTDVRCDMRDVCVQTDFDDDYNMWDESDILEDLDECVFDPLQSTRLWILTNSMHESSRALYCGLETENQIMTIEDIHFQEEKIEEEKTTDSSPVNNKLIFHNNICVDSRDVQSVLSHNTPSLRCNSCVHDHRKHKLDLLTERLRQAPSDCHLPYVKAHGQSRDSASTSARSSTENKVNVFSDFENKFQEIFKKFNHEYDNQTTNKISELTSLCSLSTVESLSSNNSTDKYTSNIQRRFSEIMDCETNETTDDSISVETDISHSETSSLCSSFNPVIKYKTPNEQPFHNDSKIEFNKVDSNGNFVYNRLTTSDQYSQPFCAPKANSVKTASFIINSEKTVCQELGRKKALSSFPIGQQASTVGPFIQTCTKQFRNFVQDGTFPLIPDQPCINSSFSSSSSLSSLNDRQAEDTSKVRRKDRTIFRHQCTDPTVVFVDNSSRSSDSYGNYFSDQFQDHSSINKNYFLSSDEIAEEFSDILSDSPSTSSHHTEHVNNTSLAIQHSSSPPLPNCVAATFNNNISSSSRTEILPLLNGVRLSSPDKQLTTLTPSESHMETDNRCFADKVKSLCQEKDFVFFKVQAAKQNDISRQKQRGKIQESLQSIRKDALLQTLRELRNRLEVRSRRWP